MEKICYDSVFGKMTYKHRWIKSDSVSLFGKEWTVTIAAKAYRNKPISEEQRDGYIRFVEDYETNLSEKVATVIVEYLKDAFEIQVSEKELPNMVMPRTLLFKQDGTTLLLMDCKLDEEHGIAVQLYPESKIGSQDLFL